MDWIDFPPDRCDATRTPKRRYQTKRQALQGRARAVRFDGERDLQVYKCPTCRDWHLTRGVPKPVQRQRKTRAWLRTQT